MPLLLDHIVPQWLDSNEGREMIKSLKSRHTGLRRPFGLLEAPSSPPQNSPDVYEYKILLSGKTNVGKTSTVARLSANEIPKIHSETPGIQTSIVYWPAKICGAERPIMFKLHFWDVGETILKKFDHVLPACRAQADAVMFTFSFTDKSSFVDLPQQISRMVDADNDNVCKFVVGTKIDIQSHVEVTQSNLAEFESHWRVPVLTTRNKAHHVENREEFEEVAFILNYICDRLWHRDQLLASSGLNNQSSGN